MSTMYLYYYDPEDHHLIYSTLVNVVELSYQGDHIQCTERTAGLAFIVPGGPTQAEKLIAFCQAEVDKANAKETGRRYCLKVERFKYYQKPL